MSVLRNIPALKYGREHEDDAVKKFIEVFSVNHKNVNIKRCGLFLDHKYPIIGASPDGIATCSCYPDASLEIKCPYSIKDTTPDSKDVYLPFLKDQVLKSSHQYYTQCQQQMNVTCTKKCYYPRTSRNER